LDSHPDAGAAGSVLRNTDGSLQYSVGRFPTVANQIGQCLLIHKVLPFVACLNGIDTNPAHYSTTRVVDWVFGAALMIRRPLIRRIGLLDEAFFMFSEEVDWCMRIRNAGLRVYLVPQSVVVHHGRTRGSSPSVYWMLVRSHLTFVRKHHGLAAAESARGLLFAGFVLRWVGWSLRAAAGSSADATGCAEVYGFSLRQLIRNRELS
jgi:N-acetylglucosaminyl-diphospho-decaprenol L-rhamnosyltransferase